MRRTKSGTTIYTWPSGEKQWVFAGAGKRDPKRDRAFDDWFAKLSPVERELHWVLPVLGIIEPRLKDPFWPKLRNSAPKTYAQLILSIYNHAARTESDFSLHETIEDIERELKRHGVGWGTLRAIRDADAGLLGSTQANLQLAEAIDKRRDEWRRRHEKCVEFIRSNESLFSPQFKKQSQRELEESLAWIRQHEKATSEGLRQAAEKTFEHLAGEHLELLEQKVAKRPRPSALLNAIVTGLVDELCSAGLRPHAAHVLTDRILNVLFPTLWPDGLNEDHVRQRYSYWSKKRLG
ncbi:MAG: hypothetical protein V3V49_13240 [Candidatus Krumholzibacteria bacterium]